MENNTPSRGRNRCKLYCTLILITLIFGVNFILENTKITKSYCFEVEKVTINIFDTVLETNRLANVDKKQRCVDYEENVPLLMKLMVVAYGIFSNPALLGTYIDLIFDYWGFILGTFALLVLLLVKYIYCETEIPLELISTSEEVDETEFTEIANLMDEIEDLRSLGSDYMPKEPIKMAVLRNDIKCFPQFSVSHDGTSPESSEA